MSKENKVILHIIDSLSIGGAEILLKNTVNALPDWQHCIVYLRKPDEIRHQFSKHNTEFICFEHSGWKGLFKTVKKFNHLVERVKPYIVHSHLFYATLIARLAVPKKTPLCSSLHSLYSIDAFQKNKKSLWAERLTLKKRHALIGVSKCVLADYFKYVPFKGKSFVLYNFLPNDFWSKPGVEEEKTDVVRFVAVGTLKEAKNYFYLLSVFELIKNKNVTLDIYGDGPLKEQLQEVIDGKGLNVKLLGNTNPKEFLPHYDVFIQASMHEGFGLSVIEAMAARLPVVLSDIPVFREITSGLAHFFPLNKAGTVKEFLMLLANNQVLRGTYISKAYNYAKANYTQDLYIQNLLHIYANIAHS